MTTQRAEIDTVITEEMLVRLPDPVQRYMNWTGVVGKPWIRTAYVRQEGRFRMAADKPWMPMKAEQVFTIDPPGMEWRARFKMFGLPLFRANDSYRDGRGHMFGKAAGLITLFDDRTEKHTHGTHPRNQSEIIWIPIDYQGDNNTKTADPVRGEDCWIKPEGTLTYGDFRIVEVVYNRPGDAN